MNNEQTNETDTAGTKDNPVSTEVKKPANLVEEARAEREKLEKVRDEARAEADRLEKLRAEEALGSSAGIAKPVEPKQESDAEYAERVKREIREGKYNG